jgi:glycosidase
MAFSFLLTTRGTPLIYYGDEIGMTGGRDPDNRRDFPGGWPEDKQNAFTAQGRTPTQEAMHAHVKKLIALRHELKPLREGAQRPLMSTHDTHAFARISGRDVAIVALNNANAPRKLNIPLDRLALTEVRQWTDHLGASASFSAVGKQVTVELPAKSTAILTPAATDLAQVPTHETQE